MTTSDAVSRGRSTVGVSNSPTPSTNIGVSFSSLGSTSSQNYVLWFEEIIGKGAI